jgi:hypothetical protein
MEMITKERAAYAKDINAAWARASAARNEYVRLIGEAKARAITAIVDVGKMLLEAKDALPHGEFIPMVENELRAIGGIRKAELLMEIARHPVLSDPQHAAHLPAAWTTLSVLVSPDLPAERLKRAIETEEVTPYTTRAEAKALLRRALPPPEDHGGSEPITLTVWLDPAVRDAFQRWAVEKYGKGERQSVSRALANMIGFVVQQARAEPAGPVESGVPF